MSNYDSQSYRTAPLIADAVSRRQIIVCSAIGIGSVGVAAASTGTQEASDRTATSKEITAAKAIHQEENFKASAARIYEALLNAKQFSTFSGGRPAEIDREVGGAFSLFGGHIVGRNLDLVPNRRIVQAWRAVAWRKASIRLPNSTCGETIPSAASSLITQAFHRSSLSTLRAGGEQTIGSRSRSI